MARHFAQEIKVRLDVVLLSPLGASFSRRLSLPQQKKFDVDVLGNKRLLTRLLRSCEKTKQVLSTIDETFCEVENLADVDFRGKISRYVRLR